MIPWYKLLSLTIRLFAKPIITYCKKFPPSTTNNTWVNRSTRRFIIFFGNKYHLMEVYINRTFSKQGTQDFFHKKLKDDAAIQKGAEALSEITLYSILILLPLYELHRQNKSSEEKKNKLNKKLENLQNGIIENQEKHKYLKGEMKEMIYQNDQLSNELKILEVKIQNDLSNLSNQLNTFGEQAIIQLQREQKKFR